MTIPSDFIQSLQFIHPSDIWSHLKSDEHPKCGIQICLINEIKPIDLFCYLAARFGVPNGIQNFLRSDDSDNLIHWEWTLLSQTNLIMFQGMNFRTEIWISGFENVNEFDTDELVKQLKDDFSIYGPRMSKARKSLEHWIEFVNPYQRLRRSIQKLSDELESLNLDPKKDALHNHWETVDVGKFKRTWDELTGRYSKGLGLCFGIRAMLPIMAESFVNVLMYLLLRSEIRADNRLREHAFRQPIDIRIKSLSLNCKGFDKTIDYSHEACKNYHSLVNERNDLLHGNISIEKLKFNELYFWEKVPVFKEYRSMWDRSIGVEQNAVGLKELQNERKVVDDFIDYILSCINDTLRPQVKRVLEKYDLGLNKETESLGILFPDWLVDMKPIFNETDEIKP